MIQGNFLIFTTIGEYVTSIKFLNRFPAVVYWGKIVKNSKNVPNKILTNRSSFRKKRPHIVIIFIGKKFVDQIWWQRTPCLWWSLFCSESEITILISDHQQNDHPVYERTHKNTHTHVPVQRWRRLCFIYILWRPLGFDKQLIVEINRGTTTISVCF